MATDRVTRATIHRLAQKIDLLKRVETHPGVREFIESLLADPEEMLDLIKIVGVPSSNNRAGHLPKERSKPLVRGVLTKEIGNLIVRFPGRFTVRMVMDDLKAMGFTFRSKNPVVAVNDVLRTFIEKNEIKVAKQGAGRTPSEYEPVEKGSNVKA